MTRKVLFILTVFSVLLSISLKAEEPDGYYKNAEGKKKEMLKTSLYSIISGGAQIISYDDLLEAYKSTDRTSSGSVYDIYSTCTFYFTATCGNYKNVCDCYNREHTVPQSWFKEASPMVSDLFHVLPTDGKINGQRSNFPYGECSNGKSIDSRARGKLGICTYPTSYTGTVFEPDDEFKGDIARIYFYMATRYENNVGSWSGGAFGNSTYPGLQNWHLELMLKWHRQDPVSQKETMRNDAVFMKQKNRNPFVDHPELAEYVFGNKTNEAWKLTSSFDYCAKIKIYTSDMNIHIEGALSAFEYKIYNVAGAVVKQGVEDEGDCTISVNRSGVYILSVKTNNSIVNKKIML